MATVTKKRVTVKPKCPNPLFEQWLTEWRDKAKESESKMQYCFSHALSTLKKYPLPLESGKDCKILKGFGEKLCKMLDDKLNQHKVQNADLNINAVDVVTSLESKKKTVKRKSNSSQLNSSREYVPQSGSGAYAILITLYESSLEPTYPGFLTKCQIIENGQKLSNVSFTKPLPNTRYTAWSSMKTLLEKSLVHKQGNPAKFTLTNEGVTLADKLYIQHKIEEFQKEDENEQPVSWLQSLLEHEKMSVPTCSGLSNNQKETILSPVSPKKNTAISHQPSSSSTQSSTTHETVILAPNSFDIILLVDTQELNGSRMDLEKDPIITQLKNLNVHHEIRNLKVGDYIWICRDNNSNNELVLPYIIERKRMDDLGQSIKDDRFHEQKFRLKQCGIKNLIYLIENHGKNEHVGLPLATLHQAATNTLIHDGFAVKFTENGKASCEYLACLTNFLQNLFKGKTLVSCPKEDLQQFTFDDDLIQLLNFQDFNRSSAKSRHFKVKEMFVKHLLQIKGMSVDKALSVVEKYPTPKFLKLHYSEITEDEKENLLSNIQYGMLKKKVGPVLSKTVYQFFCNTSY